MKNYAGKLHLMLQKNSLKLRLNNYANWLIIAARKEKHK